MTFFRKSILAALFVISASSCALLHRHESAESATLAPGIEAIIPERAPEARLTQAAISGTCFLYRAPNDRLGRPCAKTRLILTTDAGRELAQAVTDEQGRFGFQLKSASGPTVFRIRPRARGLQVANGFEAGYRLGDEVLLHLEPLARDDRG